VTSVELKPSAGISALPQLVLHVLQHPKHRYRFGKKQRGNPSSWNLKRGNSGRKKSRGWFF
jgi:hypothetical protein